MNDLRFQYANGMIGKCIPARLLPGSDLLSGIEEICKQNDIKNGYVSCIGSLQKAGYMYLVPNEDVKMKAGYGDVIFKEGPIEFLNGTGFICQRDGMYDIHFHATLCDSKGTVFGGHMVKNENLALTTLDIIIYGINGVDMLRVSDKETQLIQFYPVKQCE